MKALIELHNELVSIYGYNVEVQTAIAFWNRKTTRLVNSGNGTTLSHTMFFGPGDPNLPDTKYQYRSTLRDLITASGKSGINSIRHRRYILVLVIAAWEDHYRERIACECNKKCKNEIESAVFGDLNKYRNAIVHKRGRLDATPKALRYFAKGDEISPTSDHIDSIFRDLIDELNRLGREYYNTDPELVFARRLNNAAQTSQKPEHTATG